MAIDSPPLDSTVVVAPAVPVGDGAAGFAGDTLAPPAGSHQLCLGGGVGIDGQLGAGQDPQVGDEVAKSTVISARAVQFEHLVEGRLPLEIQGDARSALATALVQDWHPATRDNYLAAFADF